MTAPRPSFGDHDIVRLIGKGGMGTVFEVRHRATGATYAGKTILRPDDPTARERFRREAELLARVDRHPGMVKIHALGETRDGSLYLILDLVSGESLDALIEREGRLEPRRAAAIARATAAALGHVHAAGITHRDVKPANILMDADGTPRLTDFGLATARDLERLTRTGTFLGSVSYCAPEQALGGVTGPPADVFALGCVLFHALAGAPPIEGERNVDILARLASAEELPDVRRAAPEVPGPLAAIVARAIAKAPAARYADGAALELDLGRFLAGEAVAARGRPRRLAVALAPVVLLGAGLAWALIPDARTRAASEALATAGVEAAAARAALERTRSPDDPSLAAASDHLARAIALAALARSAGVADAESRAIPQALRSALAAALASARLAHGDPRSALEALDAVPGAPAALEPGGHLLRASALLGLGRSAEAVTEARAALAGGADALRANELLGDALGLGGDDAGAEAAYAHALELAARRPEATPLRAKRGGAAALAGDTALALADLDGLVPDLRLVAAERADNARFAAIAPALYVRAILGAEGDAVDRDLEAAWRLAPPPPGLAKAVARALTARAIAQATTWSTEAALHLKLEDAEIDRLRVILGRVVRARTLDPSVNLRSFGVLQGRLRTFFVANIDPRRGELLARTLLRDWPDEPIFLYVLARSRRNVHGADRVESIKALEHAVDCFPAQEMEDPAEARTLARDVASLLIDAFLDEHGAVAVDLERARTLVVRADGLDGWQRLGQAYYRQKDYDRAIDCLEKAEALATPEWPERARVAEMHAEGLMARGRVDEAVALARRLEPKPGKALLLVAQAAVHTNHQEIVVRLVDPDAVSNPTTLGVLARALVELGRADEARALQAKLEAGPNAAAALEVSKEVRAALSKQGK
jgi:tetratricopeptide (TPR) repeat protein